MGKLTINFDMSGSAIKKNKNAITCVITDVMCHCGAHSERAGEFLAPSVETIMRVFEQNDRQWF